MTPSLVVLLLSLNEAPPPTELSLLTFSREFAAAHPCKVPAPSFGNQFCVERARVVYGRKQESLVGQLEVFDAETGAKLHAIDVLSGVAPVGDKLYFNVGFKLLPLSLKKPSAKPKAVGQLDCGTEGSPYTFAVANDQPLCARDPEYSDGESVNLDVESGRENVKLTCAVAPSDFKKHEMGYALTTEHLSAECKKLLAIKK